MTPLFYDDNDDGSDISEEHTVPPPVRRFKRFRSRGESEKSSGDENAPRGFKRVKSEPVEELIVPASDSDSDGDGDGDGDGDYDSSSSPQQTPADAQEQRRRREKERQIQADVQELRNWISTIERLYSQRKVIEPEVSVVDIIQYISSSRVLCFSGLECSNGHSSEEYRREEVVLLEGSR